MCACQDMYALARDAPDERIAAAARRCFSEMRASGITSVGEFCYLHHSGVTEAGSDDIVKDYALDRVVCAAARDVGIRLCMLPTAYESSSVPPWKTDERVPLSDAQRRFDTEDATSFLRAVEELRKDAEHGDSVRVHVAAHSVRACTRATIKALGKWRNEDHVSRWRVLGLRCCLSCGARKLLTSAPVRARMALVGMLTPVRLLADPREPARDAHPPRGADKGALGVYSRYWGLGAVRAAARLLGGQHAWGDCRALYTHH